MSYQLEDLLYLMQRLRDPEHGCPWDLKQSFASIAPHTLEEAYEVADAIAAGDHAQLAGEVGDLLFQVVYYAQLGQEAGLFGWNEVVDGITRKLVRRHPHVFPDGNLRTPPGTLKLDEARSASAGSRSRPRSVPNGQGSRVSSRCWMMCRVRCRP